MNRAGASASRSGKIEALKLPMFVSEILNLQSGRGTAHERD